MRMTHINGLNSRIDVLRKQSHMSQTEFGVFLGVSQGTVSKKLNGQIPFSVEEVFECAERFNVSTEYLYGREKEEALAPV